MKNKLITLILGTAAGFAIAGAASAGTLDDVRQHGFVQCGVSQGLMGFSVPDAQNNWTGMDVDFCRAIAAAVLGDSTKVKFTQRTARATGPAWTWTTARPWLPPCWVTPPRSSGCP